MLRNSSVKVAGTSASAACLEDLEEAHGPRADHYDIGLVLRHHQVIPVSTRSSDASIFSHAASKVTTYPMETPVNTRPSSDHRDLVELRHD